MAVGSRVIRGSDQRQCALRDWSPGAGAGCGEVIFQGAKRVVRIEKAYLRYQVLAFWMCVFVAPQHCAALTALLEHSSHTETWETDWTG